MSNTGHVKKHASSVSVSRNWLSRATLHNNKDVFIDFHSTMKFFGCYWRNTEKSLSGFPTAPNGQDYVTWLWNERQRLKSSATNGEPGPKRKRRRRRRRSRSKKNKGSSFDLNENEKDDDTNNNASSDAAVRMCVKFPQSAHYTNVVLVAGLHQLTTLPDTDEDMMGQTIAKGEIEKTYGTHLVIRDIPCSTWRRTKSQRQSVDDDDAAAPVGEAGKEAEGVSSEASFTAAKKQHEMMLKDDDGGGTWSAEGVCAPKSWYLMGSMGNLRAKTKVAMLHSPITSLKDSHVDKKYLVTLRVLLLATTSTASSSSSSSSSPSSSPTPQTQTLTAGSRRQLRLQLANDAMSLDHKIAFLMASHPRLGRHSPAHMLRLVRDVS